MCSRPSCALLFCLGQFGHGLSLKPPKDARRPDAGALLNFEHLLRRPRCGARLSGTRRGLSHVYRPVVSAAVSLPLTRPFFWWREVATPLFSGCACACRHVWVFSDWTALPRVVTPLHDPCRTGQVTPPSDEDEWPVQRQAWRGGWEYRMEHGPGETSEEDRDCSDFDTQPEAQRFFEVNRSDSS